jgi:hypothetical protein
MYIRYKEIDKSGQIRYFTPILDMWMEYYPAYFDGNRKDGGLYIKHLMSLETTRMYAAFDDDTLIGVAGGHRMDEDIHEDRNLPPYILSKGWKLEDFFTMRFLINDTTYWGKGINFNMIKGYTEEFSKGYRGIIIDVADLDNKPITFFQHIGYEPIEEIPYRKSGRTGYSSACYWTPAEKR